MNLKVRLFGTLRRQDKSELNLEVPTGAGSAEIRLALEEKFGPLIRDCALADESEILRDESQFRRLQENSVIAVLPPVCGG